MSERLQIFPKFSQTCRFCEVILLNQEKKKKKKRLALFPLFTDPEQEMQSFHLQGFDKPLCTCSNGEVFLKLLHGHRLPIPGNFLLSVKRAFLPRYDVRTKPLSSFPGVTYRLCM